MRSSARGSFIKVSPLKGATPLLVITVYTGASPLTRGPSTLYLHTMVPKPSQLSRTFTVREIAGRIRRPDETLSAVIDRLRNWTKEGLLETAGAKNPGTGRRRHYPEDALVDALVLTTLSDMGIPSVEASQIKGNRKRLLEHARDAFARAAKNPQNSVCLVIERSYARSARAPGDATSIYIKDDLPQRGIAPSIRDVRIPDNIEATIVLNITALSKRITKPVGE